MAQPQAQDGMKILIEGETKWQAEFKRRDVWHAMQAVAPALVPMCISTATTLAGQPGKINFSAELLADVSYHAATHLLKRFERGETPLPTPEGGQG